MQPPIYLTPDELHASLTVRDLSDPAQGTHAMQTLLHGVLDSLRQSWNCTTHIIRNPPIVSVRDNYDSLQYHGNDVTRARRYTRYLSPTAMLRSHTSAELPAALRLYAGRANIDELLAVPGLVYRRDVVDRTHVGEPHQVDLWRIRSTPLTTEKDLTRMIGTVVDAVLPGARWRATPAVHPYTTDGRQIDVMHEGHWLELAECGRIHPEVLRCAGLDPALWSGLALGMGLDRALMLRKRIPDIRYLRSTGERAAQQMQDLSPWKPVSLLPSARRDISVVVDAGEDEETLGDVVRRALGDDAGLVESVQLLSRTGLGQLPESARERLGIRAGQDNALLRITIRPLESTLSSRQANDLRNRIYRAVHRGPHLEII
ncbi:PheS-related mystery ligase SrmL [Paeniglutamicibacter sp. R2-26]|uniref:PheS-related mystery ligase SrmL n=1 Tax=Paeniglutamicibacter sp. R2-26 TaxID=3144417 RepID=UPI003EE6F53E